MTEIRLQEERLTTLLEEAGFDPDNPDWEPTPYTQKCLAGLATMIRHLAASLNGESVPESFGKYLDRLLHACGRLLAMTGPYHADMSEEGKDLIHRRN